MARSPSSQVQQHIWLFGVVGVWAIFGLLTLTRYPIATCDEAFYARSALAYTGGGWPGAEGVLFYLPHGRAYWLVLGGVLRVLGDTLFAARLVSYLGWLGLAAGAYFVGVRFADRKIGAWAALITAVLWVPVYAGRLARPDMLAAALAVLAVGMVSIALERDRRWLWALAAFLIVLPLDFHLITVHVGWAAAFVAALTLIRRRAWANLAIFVAAGLASGALLILVHLGGAVGQVLGLLLGDPSGFVESYIFNAADAPEAGGILESVRLFASFWWRASASNPLVALVQGVFFIGGVGYGLTRANLRPLAWVVLLSSATYLLVNARYQIIGYALMWFPLLAVLGAAALTDGVMWLRERLPWVPHWAGSAALGVLAAAFALIGVWLVLREPAAAYTQTTAEISAALAPGATVVGASYWWHDLEDAHTFIDETAFAPENTVLWWNSVPLQPEVPPLALVVTTGLTPAEAEALVVERMAQHAPDYLITDGRLGCQSTITPLAQAIQAQAEALCTPVATVDSDVYGPQVIYACP